MSGRLAAIPRPLELFGLLWGLAGSVGCSSSDSGESIAGDSLGTDGGSVGDAGLQAGLDATLGLNQLQMKGTHNSYHIEPEGNMIPDWAYTRAPLDVQLREQGVRAVELDTNFDPATGTANVLHVPTIDAVSTCSPLGDCLSVLKAWSEANPGHHTIFVQLEPKDDEFSAMIDFGRYVDAVEESILSVWPRDKIVAPDDVQRDAATLREAVTTLGWPTILESRDKVLFFLNETAQFSEALTSGGTTVSGRLIFPEMEPEHDLAAVLVKNDPSSGIESVVEEGFIVRTRADGFPPEGDIDSRRAAALASGAQVVTTDFPVASDGIGAFDLPGGTPSRCNPLIAPAECTSRDIEDL